MPSKVSGSVEWPGLGAVCGHQPVQSIAVSRVAPGPLAYQELVQSGQLGWGMPEGSLTAHDQMVQPHLTAESTARLGVATSQLSPHTYSWPLRGSPHALASLSPAAWSQVQETSIFLPPSGPHCAL